MIDSIKLFLGKIGISSLKYRCFILLMLLPPIFMGYKTYCMTKDVAGKQKALEELNNKALKTQMTRATCRAYLEKLAASDCHFINNRVEPIIFLKEEITTLENILQNDVFKDNQTLLNRYKSLKEGKNQLMFQENNSSSNEEITEIEVKQLNHVEINYNDLLNLLCVIENEPINSFHPLDSTPLMFIKKIEIKKSKNKNLLLNNLTIIKRDFLKR